MSAPTCPSCGAAVHAPAKSCDYCGAALKPAVSKRRILFICIVAMIGVLACVAAFLIVALFTAGPSTITVDDMLVNADLSTLAPGQTPAIGTRAGQLAPDFTLRDSQQHVFRLNDLRGQPVILNFWASWCPPCREELPNLNSFYLDARRKGLVVIAVNTDDSDRAEAEAFIRDHNFQFTMVWDEDTRVSDQYRLSAVPVSFFIDRQGVIRLVVNGALSPARMSAGANLIY